MDIAKFIPDAFRKFLSGKATYITGFLRIVISFLSMAGLDISAFLVTPENAPQLLVIGLSSIFLRRGVKNEVKALKKNDK